jgi:hypothetical protein
MIDFDLELIEDTLNELKQEPFTDHPLAFENAELREVYLTLLCAVGKFGDEDVTTNNHVIKVLASSGDDTSVKEYAQKTATIDKNFINKLREYFVSNDIKYTLMLDILMVKGSCTISDINNSNKVTKFISDVCMLLDISTSRLELLSTLASSLLSNVTSNCVDTFNKLCKGISYQKCFSCYAKEYRIQEAFTHEDEESITITTIKGAKLDFNVDDYLNKDFTFENASFDISKCKFVFNRDVHFKRCEFYSSSVLEDNAITLLSKKPDRFTIRATFSECTFHDISFDINQELGLISSNVLKEEPIDPWENIPHWEIPEEEEDYDNEDSPTASEKPMLYAFTGERPKNAYTLNCEVKFCGCTFKDITCFHTLVNLLHSYENANLCYFNEANFNLLDGSKLYDIRNHGDSIRFANTKISNTILESISGVSTDNYGFYVDDVSKLDYTKPKDKDLSESILNTIH